MFDSIKQFLIEVAVKKMGPSAIRGACLGLIGWLAMKNNLVPGVHTDAVSHVTTIAWDQVSGWLIAGIPAGLAAVIKLVNHSAASVITTSGTTPATPTK